jgi:pimeloyl-ACP methyl ester carboxylesterase
MCRQSIFQLKHFLILILIFISSKNLISQTGQVKANGITIAYQSFGKAKKGTIILIFGTGAPMTNWPISFCEKLAKNGYRVIRFDNRDIGLSTKLDSLGEPNWAAIFPFYKTCNPAPLPYTLLDMSKDAVGLMDALKIKKAHIVGASMGGAIAQITAINFPKRVLTLTSISASSGNPNRPAANEKALQAMSIPPPSTNNPDTLSTYLVKVYKALGSTDTDESLKKRALTHINRSWYPAGTNRQVAAVFIGDYCDRRDQLAKIKIPTLVIHGDLDPIVPLECGKEVAITIPKADLAIINGLGHDISMKFVDILVERIIRNVKKAK